LLTDNPRPDGYKKLKAIAWHFDFGSIAEIYRDIDF
jgi:hypothetical protein